MSDNSAIEWTDATVNFWWGCTKVGPGCDHCYAEAWAKRTGGNIWGQGVPRRKIQSAVSLIHRLDNQYAAWAADWHVADGNAQAFGLPRPTWGPTRRVFVQSMSDLFDLEVPVEWFSEAWGRIKACNRIEIQIVTKRISVVEKRLAEIGEASWPKHAGLIVTVVNQAEADRDIPRLLALKSRIGIPWVGLSIEPMLAPINLVSINHRGVVGGHSALHDRGLGRVDWVIVGGESGPGARPMHPDWVRSLRDQCAAAGVPFFFKQWGNFRPLTEVEKVTACGATLVYREPQIQRESQNAAYVLRVGKKAAGRLLDGQLHNAFPRTAAA